MSHEETRALLQRRAAWLCRRVDPNADGGQIKQAAKAAIDAVELLKWHERIVKAAAAQAEREKGEKP